MLIEMPAEFHDYLQGAIANGKFSSETDMLADALRLHRAYRSLRADLQLAAQSLDAGEGRLVSTDEEHRALFADIERRGREKIARIGSQ